MIVRLAYRSFAEIKALDSDMKMLVYENYNKFISATDTIKKACQPFSAAACANSLYCT